MVLKTENPFERIRLCKGRSYVAVPPFSPSHKTDFSGEGLSGHVHVPSAVTGGPVAPTPSRSSVKIRLHKVFKARLSEGIRSGIVAVISPPTALCTQRIRFTGFRSSSFFPIIMDNRGFVKGFNGIFHKKRGIFLIFFIFSASVGASPGAWGCCSAGRGWGGY